MAVLPTRRRSPHRTVAIVRDIVETVAIVAAGIWACYVFIYENRIKPSASQPEIVFTADMQRLGTHHGLIAVRLNSSARNVGAVRVQFLGYSISVFGVRVRPGISDGAGETYAFSAFSKPALVYRLAYLTHAADLRTSTNNWLEPGSESRKTTILYLPLNRFDRLQCFITARLTKRTDFPIFTRLRFDPIGRASFGGDERDVENFDTAVSSLDVDAQSSSAPMSAPQTTTALKREGT